MARVGALSDGVFAFAITLLVLSIRIPHPGDSDAHLGLLDLLAGQWRSYLAYLLSFLVIGINWANHRVMFNNFARADHTLNWLNLVYLMVGAAFMPVPTAVLGEWTGDAHNQTVATVFYGTAGTVGALLFNVLWWYGVYGARLTREGMTSRERRAHTIAWAPAPLVVAAFTGLAFLNPNVAVVGLLSVVVIYMLPVPALISVVKRRRKASHQAGQ